jgi:hypothetical protein
LQHVWRVGREDWRHRLAAGESNGYESPPCGSTIPSGNVYKVQLPLAHLGASYDVSELDILGELPETR